MIAGFGTNCPRGCGAVREAHAVYSFPQKDPFYRIFHEHARCGFVSSKQTFGSFAANFHPHIHAIVTAGVFSKDGDFARIGEFPTLVIEEVFRKLVLERLHQAKRLSESFMFSLLGWVHSKFSVHAKHRIGAGDSENLEKMARYATRAPIRLSAMRSCRALRSWWRHDAITRRAKPPFC